MATEDRMAEVIDLGSSKTRNPETRQIMADRLADPEVRLQVVTVLDAMVDRLTEIRAAVEGLEDMQGDLEDILQVSKAERIVRDRKAGNHG